MGFRDRIERHRETLGGSLDDDVAGHLAEDVGLTTEQFNDVAGTGDSREDGEFVAFDDAVTD